MDIAYEHVEKAYDEIARSFDTTRRYMWNKTNKFLDSFDEHKNTKFIDVGCGNGKNMIYLRNKEHLNIFGCDISEEQVKICNEKQLAVKKCDNVCLSYEDNEFDCVISVAVIHHMINNELRAKAISELVRICKPNGKIFIQVWGTNAIGSSIDDKIQLDGLNDYLVPWRTKEGKLVAKRFYHLFEKDELEELCKLTDVKIVESFEERCNYGVILEKIEI